MRHRPVEQSGVHHPHTDLSVSRLCSWQPRAVDNRRLAADSSTLNLATSTDEMALVGCGGLATSTNKMALVGCGGLDTSTDEMWARLDCKAIQNERVQQSRLTRDAVVGCLHGEDKINTLLRRPT
jgi:hypothetical protein